MTMYQSLYYMSARYLNIENAINQAVEYVTADVIPTFYFATGHGEKNTTGGPLDLTAIDKIPDEAAMILINTPDTDYSDAQTDMLIEYVKGGGRVVLFTNESNNEMPNLMRLCKSVGLSIDADGFDDGEENKVTATVNTSSSIFSSLATNEKLTLDMTGTSAISYESVDSSLEYTSLFSFDIEQKDEKGETKVIGKDLGATVSKNGQPVFIWVSGSDTFNVSAADIGEDGREQYVIATQCLQYIVSSTRRAFTSSLEPVPAKEYDIATPLALEAGEVSLFGTLVIGIIPLALLGTGLLNIYLRKKRGSREGEQ
jgi:ABC-2 type transport system permease protein